MRCFRHDARLPGEVWVEGVVAAATDDAGWHRELRAPRSRDRGGMGNGLERYRGRTDEMDEMADAAYGHGASTRTMKEVMQALKGDEAPDSTASRITKRLDAAEDELCHAPIEGLWYSLYLDVTHLAVRWTRIVGDVAVLVAYAIGPDGYRKLLAVSLGAVEDEVSWIEILTTLLERELPGIKVIADGPTAIVTAVWLVAPEARRQRSLVEVARNAMATAPGHSWARVAKECSSIFAAPTRKESTTRLEAFSAGGGSLLPEVMKCLDEGFATASTQRAHTVPAPPGPSSIAPASSSARRLPMELAALSRYAMSKPYRPGGRRLRLS